MEPKMNKGKPMLIRLPNGWHEAIKTEAERSYRSMNSEILAAIYAEMSRKGVRLDPEE